MAKQTQTDARSFDSWEAVALTFFPSWQLLLKGAVALILETLADATGTGTMKSGDLAKVANTDRKETRAIIDALLAAELVRDATPDDAKAPVIGKALSVPSEAGALLLKQAERLKQEGALSSLKSRFPSTATATGIDYVALLAQVADR